MLARSMARPDVLRTVLAPKSRMYVWMAAVSPSVAHQRYNLTFFDRGDRARMALNSARTVSADSIPNRARLYVTVGAIQCALGPIDVRCCASRRCPRNCRPSAAWIVAHAGSGFMYVE